MEWNDFNKIKLFQKIKNQQIEYLFAFFFKLMKLFYKIIWHSNITISLTKLLYFLKKQDTYSVNYINKYFKFKTNTVTN